jgi:origin recognition complex subunit 3
VQATLEESDSATLEQIVGFIKSSSSQSSNYGINCIPTGLVIAGPSIASHAALFERLGRKIQNETNSTYILLTSGECPNLKALLKTLIKKATSRVDDDDEDEMGYQRSSTRNGPKILDFDLSHLQEWQRRAQVDKIVVAIQDSEPFDANLLTEMIELF